MNQRKIVVLSLSFFLLVGCAQKQDVLLPVSTTSDVPLPVSTTSDVPLPVKGDYILGGRTEDSK